MTLLQRITPALASALSKPYTAVRLCLAQLAWLEPKTGLSLFSQLVQRQLPLRLDAPTLDTWPAPVREAAIAHVLALPLGRPRAEAMIALGTLLPEAHRDEALDAIVDGTAPELEFAHKPRSNSALHEAFVRSLNSQQKERWIAFRVARSERSLMREMLARRAIDHWPASAIDRCCNALLSRRTDPRALPTEAIFLYAALPAALRTRALTILREHGTAEERRYAFRWFDSHELTDQEREDTVEVPWNPRTREHDRAFAQHLRAVCQHYPWVSSSLKRRILARALTLAEPYDRHCALAHIVRAVDESDRPRVTDELAALTVQEAFWPTAEERFEFFDDGALVRLVEHSAMQRCPLVLDGFVREALHRDTSSQDSIIEAALDNVIAHAHDEEIAPLCSASPWLAARSEREIPQWIAAEAQRRLAR